MPETRARISTSFEPSVRPTASSTMGAEVTATVRVVTGTGLSALLSALPPQAVRAKAPQNRRTTRKRGRCRNMRTRHCGGAASVAVATRRFSAFLRSSQACADRKIAHAVTAGGKDCIGERGCGGRQPDFACAGGVALAVDDRHFDVRGIGNAQQRIVVE